MHHYFWDSDTRIYHMLGRRDIRSSYMYDFIFGFIVYYFEVLTTRHVGEHTFAYLSIRVHVYGFYYVALLLFKFT